MKPSLAIETSAAHGSIALALADGSVDEVLLTEERGHARGIAPAIEALLAGHGLAARDLGLVVVGIGPGGFTGLRIGVATAKTLARALSIPLVALPSTLVLAAHPDVPAGPVLVVFAASKGLVYAALYEKGAPETEPHELHAPDVLAPPTAAALAGKGAFVAGDAALRVVPPPIGARGAELFPRARDALRLGLARCVETGRLDDERTVLPLYLRPSEAELLWERRRNEESAESRGSQ